MSHNRGSSKVNFCEASASITATFGEFSPHLMSRFANYVDRSGGPHVCWPWTRGRYRTGYGQFCIRGERRHQRSVYTHRLAWVLASNKPIPDGTWVLHTCDNPICCNPAHLILGNHKLNMEHAQERGRLHTPRPSRHKVTTEQLHEIDALLASGVKKVRIAEQYGVTKTWMSLYVRGLRRQYDRPQSDRVERAS